MSIRPHRATRTRARPPLATRAFTLLEVIVVLILLAVLAAVVAPRMMDMSQDPTSAIELLKVRLRYAQMRSINNVSVFGVRSTGSGYWLFSGGDLNSRELFPGENADSVTLPGGVSMSIFTVSFDNRGAPFADAAATPGSELAADSPAASITVGGQAAAVRITPGTGYIPD